MIVNGYSIIIFLIYVEIENRRRNDLKLAKLKLNITKLFYINFIIINKRKTVAFTKNIVRNYGLHYNKALHRL